MAITINDIRFVENPTFCGVCPALIMGRNDKKGFCFLFDKNKGYYDDKPKRCRDLFDKAFTYPDGSRLVIVAKK